MKKIFILFILTILPFLLACQVEYTLMYEDFDQISSIEIVDPTGDEIISLLIIDLSLHEVFLQGLSTIKFHNVYGDPPGPGSLSVKITYTNNDYEILSSYGGYKINIKDKTVYHSWLVCDEDEFNEWISLYYPLE